MQQRWILRNKYILDYKYYLWLIKVRSLELFKLGNWSLSLKRGFASISFFSSTSIIDLADFVSPYFESCSFSLPEKIFITRLLPFFGVQLHKFASISIVLIDLWQLHNGIIEDKFGQKIEAY